MRMAQTIMRLFSPLWMPWASPVVERSRRQAPANCPACAVCGYIASADDEMTAHAPGAIKIRYSNVTLAGGPAAANLFCRGAWGLYTNSAKFPGQTAAMRGNCIAIGDDGGPNADSGKTVSNITVSNLHLYGMTDGNTHSVSFGPTLPPLTLTGDGWDVTHKGIYLYEDSAFSNIRIDSVAIEDFKGENIYSGGSVVTGMVISNCRMSNFNGDGISVLAADLQVLHNSISDGSNAGIEDSSRGREPVPRPADLPRQYRLPDAGRRHHSGRGGSSAGGGNGADRQQLFRHHSAGRQSRARTGIYIVSQVGGNNVAPANVTVSGNICHDCYSFGNLQPSGTAVVEGNTFIVDKYNAAYFLAFTFPLTNVTVANNSGYLTGAAIAGHRTLNTVYELNPGYRTGNFGWKQVKIQSNRWNFPRVPNYEFNTAAGPG